MLLVGLVAASPVIASTARAVLAHWTPVFDDGVIATRAFDVLSGHPPLVGQFSDASVPSVGVIFSPGPMLFWLLAFQTHVLGDWALPVTMGVINSASIMGAIALARRLGGRVFMLATAFALVMLCRSFGAERLHDIYNPSAALLTFTLLIFLAWSVARGEYRLLPLTALVASYTAQTHLSLVIATIVLVVAASAGLMMAQPRRSPSADPATSVRRKPWVLGSLAVTLLCWSGPLLDQAFNRPGNLGRILQTATAGQRTEGVIWGWHALVRTVGLVPWWLQVPPMPVSFGRVLELSSAPDAVGVISSALVVGGLLVVSAVGLRRRHADLVIPAVLALGLNAAVVAVAAQIPANQELASDRSLYFASAVGMYSWLALGWSLSLIWRETSWAAIVRSKTSALSRPPAAVPLLGVCIVATAAALITAAQGPDLVQYDYRPVGAIAARVKTLPSDRPVLIETTLTNQLSGIAVELALVYQLRKQGYQPVVTAGSDLDHLGSRYTLPQAYGEVLLIGPGGTPAPNGSHILARFTAPSRLTPPYFGPVEVSAAPARHAR